MKINERPINCLLNSSFKVNILPYNIVLSLGVYSNIQEKALANIKDTSFYKYVPEVPICINRIIVKLSFFTSWSSGQCILSQLFKAATQMARETMNDGFVQMTIFNMKSQDCVIFQPYTPGSSIDYRGHELV